MDPLSVDDVETVDLVSDTNSDTEWVGGFFAYGGKDADSSVVITFAIPAGKRLGNHTDTAEETQFIVSGAGELVRQGDSQPIKAGDVVVLKEGESHDLVNTGSEDLRVIGFFSAPQVEQHWTDDSWGDDGKVTGSPNR